MRSALLLLGVLLVLSAHPAAQTEAPQRFGTRYLTGRAGVKKFDSGLAIAADRVIVTTAKRKNGVYVEAFSIPLATITSAVVTTERHDDAAAQIMLGGRWTNTLEYLTIVTDDPQTGGEALVFQVSIRQGAGIVAKINVAIKKAKVSEVDRFLELDRR